MRRLERRVMLSVIDQRWRAHLYEMDYLREGINLRAMGQKDPLVEWQREGFDMFGQMMHGIWQDAIRYLMHVEIEVRQQVPVDGGGSATPVDAPQDSVPADDGLRNVQYSSPEDPSSAGGSASMAAAARAEAAGGGAPAGNGANGQTGATATATADTNTPVRKSEWDKTPRNAPCPCGSGKKFKACHGR